MKAASTDDQNSSLNESTGSLRCVAAAAAASATAAAAAAAELRLHVCYTHGRMHRARQRRPIQAASQWVILAGRSVVVPVGERSEAGSSSPGEWGGGGGRVRFPAVAPLLPLQHHAAVSSWKFYFGA